MITAQEARVKLDEIINIDLTRDMLSIEKEINSKIENSEDTCCISDSEIIDNSERIIQKLNELGYKSELVEENIDRYESRVLYISW